MLKNESKIPNTGYARFFLYIRKTNKKGQDIFLTEGNKASNYKDHLIEYDYLIKTNQKSYFR